MARPELGQRETGASRPWPGEAVAWTEKGRNTVSSMAGLGVLGGDSDLSRRRLEEMALRGWGPELRVRGTQVFGRGHRNVGGGMGQISYAFRKQRIGGATDGIEGHETILWRAEWRLGQVRTRWSGWCKTVYEGA